MRCHLLDIHCRLHSCRRHTVDFIGCMFTMLAELRRCGIYDDVAQWHSLDTFLHSLTMFSTCWQYCLPGLPPPSIPTDEYESVAHLVYTNVFDEDYIRIFNGNYDLKCWMTFKRITPLSISWDPTQAHRSKPCETYCRRLFLPLSSTTSCDSPSLSTSPFVPRHRNSSPRCCTNDSSNHQAL